MSETGQAVPRGTNGEVEDVSRYCGGLDPK